MGNSFFRFKQFTVNQEHCAMKVCTDACLFGAWMAARPHGGKTLDIGTGTGLLSLMYAQKSDALIDAIEIDEPAFLQAADNFNASPWKNRLNIFYGAVQDTERGNYEMVIANPPFYENYLKSNDKKRNLALHNESLGLEELLASVKRLISSDGRFALLLPFYRATQFEKLAAEKELYLSEKVLVKQTPDHDYFRVMYLYSNVLLPTAPLQYEIIIKNASGFYTKQFEDLLMDYYLFEKND